MGDTSRSGSGGGATKTTGGTYPGFTKPQQDKLKKTGIPNLSMDDLKNTFSARGLNNRITVTDIGDRVTITVSSQGKPTGDIAKLVRRIEYSKADNRLTATHSEFKPKTGLPAVRRRRLVREYFKRSMNLYDKIGVTRLRTSTQDRMRGGGWKPFMNTTKGTADRRKIDNFINSNPETS